MSESAGILRRVDSDNDFVAKRVDVLEGWAQSGEMEPWLAVVLAEWLRTDAGRSGEKLTEERFEELFLDEELLAVMREQVDGPWLVYVEQARAQRANNMVMGFLTELENAAAK